MYKSTSLYRSTLTIIVSIFVLVTFIGCGQKFQLTPLQQPDPPVSGENGMVVAAHPLAADAGLQVLKDGGNAVDATLAALFMLNVVEPHASGLGGGGFAVVRMSDGDAKIVTYREKAPKGIDTDFYFDPSDTNHVRKNQGSTAICVPGAAAGWAELYETWATKPLAELAAPAIKAAEDGFPIDKTLAGQISNNFQKIILDTVLTSIFLQDSLPLMEGDTLRQPDLAKTFRQLVDKNLRSFYRGFIAEAVVEASTSNGGYMALSDLEFFRAEKSDPVQTDFEGSLSGYTALTVPPPSSGGSALIEALNLFDLTDATDYEVLSADAIHLMAQCLQQAYADAKLTVEDPLAAKHDWEELSTSAFARMAAEGISLEARAGPRSAARGPNLNDHGNTSHLVVVDKAGNAVSLTQSINWFFGAGVIAPGTGLLMNNQMADFSLPPDSINILAGGIRPRSNMAPLILLKDGKPVLIVGTPGGGRIVAAMAQIVANVVSFDLDISTAIDYPRFFANGQHLVMENRFGKDVIKKLKKHKYILHIASSPYHVFFGGAHGITIDQAGGKIYGAADKRRGGVARGY